MLLLLLSATNTYTIPGCLAQFNEPPGARREQTFRVEEFELSNINQHFPGDLRYYCTFRGKWSGERHPKDFPKSPSWSAPTIVSHSKDWRMWTGTETVTAGVEYLAEQGFPTIMYNEFQNAGFETLHMIVGERMFNTTESQELPPINVTYTHPFLSAMTKITPSPDWFVGFSDLRTISYDTETYYNRIVVKSYVWDAGTDEGEAYHSFDRDLDPQIPCMRFCVPTNVGGGGEGTKDSNVNHEPDLNRIHHPTALAGKCPDKDKGRTAVPRGGQFLDYTGTYIPYPAEYECVLRVGNGEVYPGNAFHEDQIRPPLFVPRPDDDFLDGISPYDQPAYDIHVAEINYVEPEEEPEGWNKNLLWLILLLLLLCCAPFCAFFAMYMMFYRKKKNKDGSGTGGGDGTENGEDGDTNQSLPDEAFLDEATAEHDSNQEFSNYDYSNIDPSQSDAPYYDDDTGYGDVADEIGEDDEYSKFLLESRRVAQDVVYGDDDSGAGYGESGDAFRTSYRDDEGGGHSSYRDGDVL